MGFCGIVHLKVEENFSQSDMMFDKFDSNILKIFWHDSYFKKLIVHAQVKVQTWAGELALSYDICF